MCVDPATAAVLAISTAATVGGGMMDRREDEKNAARQASARNAVLSQTLDKNRKLSEESYGTFDKRLAEAQPEPQQGQLEGAREKRVAEAKSTIREAAPGEVPLSGSAPKVVQSQLAKRLSEAQVKNEDAATKIGNLSAYGDQWFQNNLDNVEAARGIDTTRGFAQQNLSLMPALQDLAQYGAYKPKSGLGTALQQVGQIGATTAGAGWFR